MSDEIKKLTLIQMEGLLNQAIPREVEFMKGEAYGLFGFGLYQTDFLNNPVNKVLYCVTPTPAVVKYFKAGNYDALISHHPYVQRNIPHFVYHTALDCCEGGLNDQWRDALGVKNAQHFVDHLGWYGKIEPIKFSDLVEKVKEYCGGVKGQKYLKPGADDIIRSVVICTGLGGIVNALAETSKADCYILGEACQEANTTSFKAMIETGHTLSEWMGVKVFRKLLEPYGIQVDAAPLEKDVYGTEIWKKSSDRSYNGNF